MEVMSKDCVIWWLEHEYQQALVFMEGSRTNHWWVWRETGSEALETMPDIVRVGWISSLIFFTVHSFVLTKHCTRMMSFGRCQRSCLGGPWGNISTGTRASGKAAGKGACASCRTRPLQDGQPWVGSGELPGRKLAGCHQTYRLLE